LDRDGRKESAYSECCEKHKREEKWLKRKKERNIKKRYKRRKQDRERKNIINVKEEK